MRARYNNGTRPALRRLLSNSRPARLVMLEAKCSPKRNHESTCRYEIQAITRCHLGVDSPVLPVRIVLI